MQQQSNASQTQGHAQAKTEEWIQSAQNTTNATREKASNAAQSAEESAQDAKEQSAGFLQQTGEKVVHMAQGAVDGVKNTLGIGESNK
ncbi:hypothetical protein ACOSP7_006591 [Xanthoceras sorbifolium]|uniref:Late embryogenesis abundant protein 1-like n=1 Tax=Xanthoceras sorbifolium TaxID=99658 RepID=A0ABQ8I923_9ROSI|nr:hypothetical protein JRO89_XS03G0075600 [Xanthoceras sorbifolium]